MYYKKEMIKKMVNTKTVKTGFLCNNCGSELLEQGLEVYCSNEECFVDWTPDEIITQFLEFKRCARKEE